MKLIAISGAKNTGKSVLAEKLSLNSDCIWIKPYTDKKRQREYIYLNDKQLNDKMQREEPLLVSEVNGNKYVFFKNQLNAEYVVLIGDDRVINYLKNEWDGDLVTIKCHSKMERPSSRSTLDDDEFDIVYDTLADDYDTLEASLV